MIYMILRYNVMAIQQFFSTTLSYKCDGQMNKLYLSQLMRLWYLSHRRPAKAQVNLRSLARVFAVRTHEVWK